MADRRAEDWLGPLIESELSAAVVWMKRQKLSNIKVESGVNIKPDPEGVRIQDDGSNTRVVTASHDLKKVQIVKVLQLHSPLACSITDGFTEITARFSDNVTATVEAELERTLSIEDHGDCLLLKKATVVATPYGTADCQIQLDVDEVEYLYHLRKAIGSSQHAGSREEVVRLIADIENIRRQQYGDVELDDEMEDATSTPPPNQQQPDRRQVRKPSDAPAQVPALDSRPFNIASQQLNAVQSQAIPLTQLSPSKDIPKHHRPPTGPTLRSDGWEMRQGVNLNRPTGRATTEREPSPPDRVPPLAVTNERMAKLGNILGKRKASPEPSVSLNKAPEIGPQEQFKVPEKPTQRQKAILPQSHESTSPGPSTIAAATPTGNVIRPLHSTSVSMRSRYARRKIPADQQRLLDSHSSWIPSLPGRQFPHPNVPVKLLEQWNESHISAVPTSPQPHTLVDQTSPVDEPQSSSESASSDSESDSEILPWPSTPSQRKPEELPPDSSLPEVVVQATPTNAKPADATPTKALPTQVTPTQRPPASSGDLEMAVPRPLPDPMIAHRKARSEHFKQAQRRDWVRKNYTPNTIRISSLVKLVQAYRQANPNDAEATPEAIEDAINVAFPVRESPRVSQGSAHEPPGSQRPLSQQGISSTQSPPTGPSSWRRVPPETFAHASQTERRQADRAAITTTVASSGPLHLTNARNQSSQLPRIESETPRSAGHLPIPPSSETAMTPRNHPRTPQPAPQISQMSARETTSPKSHQTPLTSSARSPQAQLPVRASQRSPAAIDQAPMRPRERPRPLPPSLPPPPSQKSPAPQSTPSTLPPRTQAQPQVERPSAAAPPPRKPPAPQARASAPPQACDPPPPPARQRRELPVVNNEATPKKRWTAAKRQARLDGHDHDLYSSDADPDGEADDRIDSRDAATHGGRDTRRRLGGTGKGNVDGDGDGEKGARAVERGSTDLSVRAGGGENELGTGEAELDEEEEMSEEDAAETEGEQDAITPFQDFFRSWRRLGSNARGAGNEGGQGHAAARAPTSGGGGRRRVDVLSWRL